MHAYEDSMDLLKENKFFKCGGNCFVLDEYTTGMYIFILETKGEEKSIKSYEIMTFICVSCVAKTTSFAIL